MKRKNSRKAGVRTKKTILQRLQEDKWYLLFILPAIAYLIAFVYRPMYGILMAFQEYEIGDPILAFDGSVKWVGFKQFIEFFNSPFFSRILLNTLRLSLESLVFGCWVPMAVALLLNEIRVSIFKRTFQTVYYMPYFISIVVLVGMMMSMMDQRTGIINTLLGLIGIAPINFFGRAEYFRHLYVWSGVWQTAGYSSIIYVAALAGVSQDLQEAAMIDGASRLQRIINVDIPSILPTIVIQLIFNCASVVSIGMDKVFLMQNDLNAGVSEVISTFVYKVGVVNSNFGYSTAAGLFQSLVAFSLLIIVNKTTKKLTETSLF